MIQETNELLFEIGVEELPAGYIKSALESWSGFIMSRLDELKLSSQSGLMIDKYSTPRRLTLHLAGIKLRQDDEEIEKIGPAVNAAFDENGFLTNAGKGFLRGAQVAGFEKLVRKAGSDVLVYSNGEEASTNNTLLPYIKKTAKGEYIAVSQKVPGKEAAELLGGLCKESLAKITFPKTMRWKEKGIRFARPVRWIVALWGEEVLDFEAAGVKSGKVTVGNVFGKRGDDITITKIADYLPLLEEHFVLADREKRFDVLQEQVHKKAKQAGGIVTDIDLFEEVADLVEYPTAVLAGYEEEYLVLPPKVIHSTLAKNQRYFPVYEESGRLLNRFVYAANNLPEYAENTKDGNERVVRARLADARFYFEEDRHKSVTYFNDQLAGVVFHVKLGSIREKVERIVKISEYLCEQLAITEETKQKVLRTAEICKFDLATAMIGEKEFTSLQGYMGKEYALLWGEDEETAVGIEEHYLPVGLGDLTKYFEEKFEEIYSAKIQSIPSGIAGQIVSLADKSDTLCAFFGIGVIPSGSKDQYGLRRTGNSIIKLINEAKLNLSLNKLVDKVYSLLPGEQTDRTALNEFLKQRTEQYLQKSAIAYDVVNAVLGIGLDDIIKTVNRAIALQQVRKRDDFEHLMLSFKRVSNIIAAAKEFTVVDETAFCEDAEKELYSAIEKVTHNVKYLLHDNDYAGVLEEFVSLNGVIDKFFDKVLVNTEDETIKNNRYGLLNSLRELFLNIGDLSLIVIE